MRIYFGRPPVSQCVNLDSCLHNYLHMHDWDWIQAMNAVMGSLQKSYVYYTINPMIINHLSDEQAKQLVWIIDQDGVHIRMGADARMCEKLEVMGPGEIVIDDARTFKFV